jgi:phosphoribosylformylglycinamidine cyclo-ligase
MKYEDSGVNIDKANQATKAISAFVKSTWGTEVLSEVGHFGGLFRVPDGCKDPVLVSSMDGVGTKIMVAQRAGRYDTIGQDLVNHCVDDILVQGGRPLFFLDYLAAGALQPEMVVDVVRGLSTACRSNGCALIGGETAEMPGLYHGEDFDLAGCIVGVVERGAIIDGSDIQPGDVLFAMPSNGLHTNGFSLTRQLIFDKLGLSVDDFVEEFGCTVADELLKIHVSYLDPVTDLSKGVAIKGLAHVTGGGVLENLPRILPEGCGAEIRSGSWPVPPVFTYIQDQGDIVDAEMYRVFNMGIGMLVVIGKKDADKMPDTAAGTPIHKVGLITPAPRTVNII